MNESCIPDDVLNFWFSQRVKPLWFKKKIEFDREIERRFFDTYQLARTGKLDSWRNDPHGALASIILLDQFPRNMFRNTPQAFATDNQAVELAKYAVDKGYERDLSPEERSFLYMPLMHSEDKVDQAKCVELFTKLGKEENLKFAIKHREIVDRFGRFPHRNEMLDRTSTSAEQEFLTQPGSSF
ncbi:DUF924 domain-containing protein [Pleurocapsales cyanobacterium LEGE 10410]|nr:DUF924 domain-containing protein [Pleurocapsales cyanobacterium LEGE 10410]